MTDDRFLRNVEAQLDEQLGHFAPLSREEYTRRFRSCLLNAGWLIRKAKYDKAGNCLTCGEAGRCPGIHAYDPDHRGDA